MTEKFAKAKNLVLLSEEESGFDSEEKFLIFRIKTVQGVRELSKSKWPTGPGKSGRKSLKFVQVLKRGQKASQKKRKSLVCFDLEAVPESTGKNEEEIMSPAV